MKNKIWITAANGMVEKLLSKDYRPSDSYDIISLQIEKDLEQTSQIDVETG